MQVEQVATTVGVAGCVALILAVVAPYALVTDPVGLGPYYAAGPIGANTLAFLAVLEIVVFLAGERGQADSATAAGIAVVVGLAVVATAAVWSLTLNPNIVFSFPAADAWIEHHRWLLLALAGVVFASSAWYAKAAVS